MKTQKPPDKVIEPVPKAKKSKDSSSSESFHSAKYQLKNILLDYDTHQPLLNDLVLKCNNLVSEAYLFIRLFCLFKYHHHQPLPKFDDKFFKYCIKILGKAPTTGRKAKDILLKDELLAFYLQEYSPLRQAPLFDLTNMSQLIDYLATQVKTGIMNNLKEHFITRLLRFVNCTIPDSKKKENKADVRKLKNALLNNKPTDVPEKYYEWYYEYRNVILPLTWKESLAYDVKANPTKYLFYSFYMNEELEYLGCKLFQPLALRTNIVPKYITIDTFILIRLFGENGTKQKMSEASER